MTVLIARSIRWIEQAMSETLHWNQVRVQAEGAEEIVRATDRNAQFVASRRVAEPRFREVVTERKVKVMRETVVATDEVVPATDDAPAHTLTHHEVKGGSETVLVRETRAVADEATVVLVPFYRYGAQRVHVDAVAEPVWRILQTLFGEKWPITWFHYDVATQLCQYRYQVTIGTDSEERTGSTQDESVVQACVDACEHLSRLISEFHGHPITPVEVTRVIEEPLSEVASEDLDLTAEGGLLG